MPQPATGAAVDLLDSWVGNILKELLPAPYLLALRTQILSPTSPTYRACVASLGIVRFLAARATPIVTRITARLAAAADASPDVVVAAALLGALFSAWMVANWLRRMVMWWMQLALRAAVVAGLVVILAVAYQRGLERSASDVFLLGRRAAQAVVLVRDVWLREYERWQQQERR